MNNNMNQAPYNPNMNNIFQMNYNQIPQIPYNQSNNFNPNNNFFGNNNFIENNYQPNNLIFYILDYYNLYNFIKIYFIKSKF